MRRYVAASAFVALTALVAVPASAGPIVFVSGPSPIAIVSGTLTMNGPQVNPGLFVLEAAGGIPTWPGGLTPGPGGLASAAALFSAGRPFVGDSPVRLPAAASPVASPAPVTLPFIAIGFDLSPQEAQFLFALSLLGLGTENAQALGDSLHLAAFDTGGGIDAPEPGTVLLLASGLAGVLLARRRRRA